MCCDAVFVLVMGCFSLFPSELVFMDDVLVGVHGAVMGNITDAGVGSLVSAGCGVKLTSLTFTGEFFS